MKIGILTFHWATNYGAVLQTYALQQYLSEQGHQVEIINYKPRRYDWMGIRTVLRHPKCMLQQLRLRSREKLISGFRDKYLNATLRYTSSKDMRKLSSQYDVVISGSDQVLNPSFTCGGEGHPTDAYFLGFVGGHTLRLGYAVSFGCQRYPTEARKYADGWIHNFDAVGFREESGKNILLQLGYEKPSKLVPDPTLLIGDKIFDMIKLPTSNLAEYTCVYLLGDTRLVNMAGEQFFFIDEQHQSLGLEKWLSCIRGSKALVTNSYHGMLMGILMHKPFAVLSKKQKGQNDRLFTVLSRLGLSNRIVENDNDSIKAVLNQPISWDAVDAALCSFRSQGVEFLNESFRLKK